MQLPERWRDWTLGRLYIRWAHCPTDRLFFHRRMDGYTCDWMIEWRKLWIVWNRDPRTE